MTAEAYWDTEARPLTAKEMAARVVSLAEGLRDLPEVGTENLFGEIWTDKSIRAHVALNMERLASMSAAFAKALS